MSRRPTSLPQILAEGDLLDYQQSSPRGHSDTAVGFIHLEWGCTKAASESPEVGINDSRTRQAMAESQSIADTIAFQVNQAYRQMEKGAR